MEKRKISHEENEKCNKKEEGIPKIKKVKRT